MYFFSSYELRNFKSFRSKVQWRLLISWVQNDYVIVQILKGELEAYADFEVYFLKRKERKTVGRRNILTVVGVGARRGGLIVFPSTLYIFHHEKMVSPQRFANIIRQSSDQSFNSMPPNYHWVFFLQMTFLSLSFFSQASDFYCQTIQVFCLAKKKKELFRCTQQRFSGCCFGGGGVVLDCALLGCG
jgi:hypothetical protein